MAQRSAALPQVFGVDPLVFPWVRRVMSALAGVDHLLEIALACGFRSKATFNRIFKQQTGLTPTQYRAGR